MYLLIWAIWGLIWKRTVEKSQTNATNVNMHPVMQALWGHIWKHTVEKSQTNATNVTMPLLRQAIWGNIWKRTVEKSQTNATNVTLPLLVQAIWGHIWKRTVGNIWRVLTPRMASLCVFKIALNLNYFLHMAHYKQSIDRAMGCHASLKRFQCGFSSQWLGICYFKSPLKFNYLWQCCCNFEKVCLCSQMSDK